MSPHPPSEPGPAAPGAPSAPLPSQGRVLHVMRMKGVYGAERHLFELTSALRSHGWASDVLILAPEPPQMFDFASELAQVCGKVSVFRMRGDLSPALMRRLVRELRSGAYDVVHSHMVHADWHLAVASLAAPRVAVISSKHNHDPFRRRRLVRLVEHASARRFAEIISISESLRGFTEETAGVAGTTVRYGLSAPDWAPVRGDDSRQSYRLLSVGRLEPQKGFDVLMRAMAIVRGRVPEARLSLAGEGGERAMLEDLIATLGLEEHVTLLGRREDVRQLMRDAAALVHPARWEGFGLVLLEAMREGLPVIATRVGAIPEVVDDGVTGWLVPPDDPEALAAAIVEFLQDPAAGAAAGEAAFARLTVRFSPDRMAQETAEVYRASVRSSG
jgi:glycosyltransferase involved in cell wall biosynthesis